MGDTKPIDGLRGLAVGLVVLYHTWLITWQPIAIFNYTFEPLADYGFLGVDMFFFVSGFVLLLPYARAHLGVKPTPNVRVFFWRRFIKLVPSYTLLIVVLLLLGSEKYPSRFDMFRDVLFHFLFIHNWFQTTYGTISGPIWSLGVEVQFYVFFPLLAPLFVRYPVLTATLMAALANGWRRWALLTNGSHFEQKLAQLPGWLDLFAAGMLAAYLFVALGDQRNRKTIFSLLMLAGMWAFWLYFKKCQAYFHGDHAYDALNEWKVYMRSVGALIFFCIAVGSLFAHRPLKWILTNPPIVFTATISYNFYLWHQKLEQFLARVLLAHGHNAQTDPVWQFPFFVISLSASIILAAVLTYAFERPILRAGKAARWANLGANSGVAPAAPSRMEHP